MYRIISRALLTASLLLSTAAHSSSIGNVTSFGRIIDPEGDYLSLVNGISGDGSVVIGTGSTGIQSLYRNGDVRSYGNNSGWARGVSTDGSIIVGEIPFLEDDNGRIFAGPAGFIYEDGETSQTGFFPDTQDLLSSANAVSDDGSVVVGWGRSGSGNEGFIFENNALTGIGDLAGGFFESYAHDVSSDGSIVVGSGWSDAGPEPIVFKNNELIGLGVPEGWSGGSAWGVSADGTTIFGQLNGGAAVHAAFVYEIDSFTVLEDLAGGEEDSYPRDITADGSVLVGYGRSDRGREATVWFGEDYTPTALEAILFESGIDLEAAGWFSLTEVTGISADGTVMVGRGMLAGDQFTSAWIATLSSTNIPVPTAAWFFASGLLGLVGCRKFNKDV